MIDGHDYPHYLAQRMLYRLCDESGDVIPAVDAFCRGYAEALLWANTSTNCECLTCMSDGSTLEEHGLISDDFAYRYQSPGRWWEGIGIDFTDAIDFLADNFETMANISTDWRHDQFGFWDCMGHDFALTRNGHGAGFWDRGFGDIGDTLTDACRPYGEHNLYVDADDKIWNE